MWWVDGWKEGRKNGWIIRKQKRKVWGCDTHSHLGSENPLTSSHVQFGASPVRVGVDAALKHSPRGLHWSAVLGIRLWCTHKDPAHQEERAFGTKKGQLMVKSSPNHGCVVWMLPGRSISGFLCKISHLPGIFNLNKPLGTPNTTCLQVRFQRQYYQFWALRWRTSTETT